MLEVFALAVGSALESGRPKQGRLGMERCCRQAGGDARADSAAAK